MKKENLLKKYFIEYTAYALNVHPKRYARRVTGEIQYFLDWLPASLSSPDEVYLSERLGYVKHLEKRGLSPSTVSWIFDILRSFWTWMKRKEYATYNPFRTLDPQY